MKIHAGIVAGLAMASVTCMAADKTGADDAPMPPHSLTLTTPPPYRYDFQLEKGKGTSVCDAYLKRLRSTDFYRIPQCDRPENTSVPGFKALNRLPLTRAEVLALYEPVDGWLFLDDLDHYKKMRADNAKLGKSLSGDGAEFAAKINTAQAEHGVPTYYKIEPVDIGNDGTPDRLIVWKRQGLTCGEQSVSAIFPVVVETYLVAVDSRGELDIGRTRDLLEWHDQPVLENLYTRGPIQKMARTFGVFSFGGEYYTDAFYPSTENLEQQYRAGKTVSDLLGVFHRKNGISTVACEIRWYDRAQNSASN